MKIEEFEKLFPEFKDLPDSNMVSIGTVKERLLDPDYGNENISKFLDTDIIQYFSQIRSNKYKVRIENILMYNYGYYIGGHNKLACKISFRRLLEECGWNLYNFSKLRGVGIGCLEYLAEVYKSNGVNPYTYKKYLGD